MNNEIDNQNNVTPVISEYVEELNVYSNTPKRPFNFKKTILIVLGVIVIIALAVCFIIALQKHNEKQAISEDEVLEEVTTTAADISEEFDNISYEEEENIESIEEEQEKKTEEATNKSEKNSSKSSSSNSSSTSNSSSNLNITKGGSYNFSGSYGCITINTSSDVKLNLNGATISCSSGPAINVLESDTVTINLIGFNKVSAITNSTYDAAIYSKADLVFGGSGSLNVSSNYDGIVSKDTLVFNSGTYTITASDDGIRGKDNIAILTGTYNITASGDGIKSTNEDGSNGYIIIDGGTFNITSSNDGIQAVTNLNINGGTFNIKTAGGYQTVLKNNITAKGLKAGSQIVIKKGTYSLNTADDAIHSNGTVLISGGTLNIQTGDDALHADGTLQVSGGTIIVSHCYEGLEGSTVTLTGGNTTITASDDGLNALGDNSTSSNTGRPGADNFKNSTGKIVIKNGTLQVYSNADGIDCNGSIEMSGGNVYVESSNTDLQSALDHDNTMTITGGTIVALSKSSGAGDNGTLTSNVPYIYTTVNNASGKIVLDSISYTPKMSEYKYIFIASSSLSTGSATLTYGNNSTNVTLSTGNVSTLNNGGFGGNTRPGGR